MCRSSPGGALRKSWFSVSQMYAEGVDVVEADAAIALQGPRLRAWIAWSRAQAFASEQGTTSKRKSGGRLYNLQPARYPAY